MTRLGVDFIHELHRYWKWKVSELMSNHEEKN